jgi:hypothetical protein
VGEILIVILIVNTLDILFWGHMLKLLLDIHREISKEMVILITYSKTKGYVFVIKGLNLFIILLDEMDRALKFLGQVNVDTYANIRCVATLFSEFIDFHKIIECISNTL